MHSRRSRRITDQQLAITDYVDSTDQIDESRERKTSHHDGRVNAPSGRLNDASLHNTW
jgi:hypothetical protein